MAKVYYSDPLFDEMVNNIPKRIAREVDLFLDIVYRIDEILKRKGWTQADLAKAMGKKEPEISKWLSGSHNFTIATIAKIEAALGEDIISVKRYRKPVSGYEGLPTSKRQHLSENSRPEYGKRRTKSKTE